MDLDFASLLLEVVKSVASLHLSLVDLVIHEVDMNVDGAFRVARGLQISLLRKAAKDIAPLIAYSAQRTSEPMEPIGCSAAEAAASFATGPNATV